LSSLGLSGFVLMAELLKACLESQAGSGQGLQNRLCLVHLLGAQPQKPFQ
jgi:hypothetical protein